VQRHREFFPPARALSEGSQPRSRLYARARVAAVANRSASGSPPFLPFPLVISRLVAYASLFLFLSPSPPSLSLSLFLALSLFCFLRACSRHFVRTELSSMIYTNLNHVRFYLAMIEYHPTKNSYLSHYILVASVS